MAQAAASKSLWEFNQPTAEPEEESKAYEEENENKYEALLGQFSEQSKTVNF